MKGFGLSWDIDGFRVHDLGSYAIWIVGALKQGLWKVLDVPRIKIDATRDRSEEAPALPQSKIRLRLVSRLIQRRLALRALRGRGQQELQNLWGPPSLAGNFLPHKP